MRRDANVWTMSTGQLNWFYSEQSASGFALPVGRNRPIIPTHDVAGRDRGPRAQWTWFFQSAPGVKHHSCRQRPVETIGRAIG